MSRIAGGRIRVLLLIALVGFTQAADNFLIIGPAGEVPGSQTGRITVGIAYPLTVVALTTGVYDPAFTASATVSATAALSTGGGVTPTFSAGVLTHAVTFAGDGATRQLTITANDGSGANTTTATFTVYPAYSGGQSSQLIDGTAVAPVQSYDGVVLTVAISGGVASEDVLQLINQSPLALTGSVVRYNGTIVGSYVPGLSGAPMTVTFNALATPAAVSAVLAQTAYLNLAGATPVLGPRPVVASLSDGGPAIVVLRRTVAVVGGNATPAVVANTGITVNRSAAVLIPQALLRAQDSDHPAAQDLTYTVGNRPQRGRLLRASAGTAHLFLPLVGGQTFTQEDIDQNRLKYEHDGSVAASDSFTVTVADPLGASTPTTGIGIVIQGTQQDPVITLGSGASLDFTEGGATAVLEGSGPASITITDADSPHYGNATLDVEFVTAQGDPAGHSGDVIALRAQDSSNAGTASGLVTVQTGNTVIQRRYPNDGSIYTGNLAAADAFPTLTGYPNLPSQSYGVPFDYAVATIDSGSDGLAGRRLRLTLVGAYTNRGAPNNDVLVTPAMVARIIANLTFRNESNSPPTTTRLLRLTLREATPNPGVGVTTLPVTITATNDPPVITSPSAGAPALVGITGVPVIGQVLAEDDDQGIGAAPVFEVVTGVGGTDLGAGNTLDFDTVSGAFTVQARGGYTGTMTLVVQARDSAGAASSSRTITIQVQAPATSVGVVEPYVVTDPPFEIDAGTTLYHAFQVQPDLGPGVPDVSVVLVGNPPPGAMIDPVGLQTWTPITAWSLTTLSGVLATPSGLHVFGVLVRAVYPGGIVVESYHPITLRVHAPAGAGG